MYPGQQQERPLLPSPQYSFAGGINTAVPSDRLSDDEASDIVNLRFNDQDSLLPRDKTVTVTYQIGGVNITNRITSVFSAYYSDGTIRNLFTSDAKVYQFTAAAPTAPTLLGSAGSFNTFWQWKMYKNLAIGTNRVTIPKSVDSAGTFGNLSINAPTAKYIEIWNDRVWLVGADSISGQNTVYGSALGAPTDWTTTGAAGACVFNIEPDDGDFITGIIAFRERLFIFKRNRIYTMQAVGGAFPTDATALSVELYSQNVGCVSAYSIQPVLDDVLFLTDGGIASLVASEKVGDFQASLLSRKIQELKELKTGTRDGYEIAAFVVPEHSQYWLLLPEDVQSSIQVGIISSDFGFQDNAYILDYRRIQEGIVRWSRYTGAAAGLVMCGQKQSAAFSTPTYFIAGRLDGAATTFRILNYLPTNNPSAVSDNSTGLGVAAQAIRFRLLTKRLDLNFPFNRKDFKRMAFNFVHNDGATATVLVTYYLDDNLTVAADSWSLVIPNAVAREKVNRKFKYSTAGRRGTNVAFDITMATVGRSFGINAINIWYQLLPEKRATYF